MSLEGEGELVSDRMDGCTSSTPSIKSTSHGAPFGQRTIIGLIEQVARDDPLRVFGSCPISTTLDAGFRDITYGQLAYAVDRGAWWFERCFGKQDGFPTIAWIGPMDFRYIVLPLAANKAGYKLFLLSPRNTLEYQLHLLQSSECNILLRDENAVESKRILDSAENVKGVIAPTLEDLLCSDEVDPYHWSESTVSLTRPFVVLHSSGSTGMPKCILWTHKTFASLDAQHLLPSRDGFSPLFASLAPGNFLSLFPPFHAGGLLFAMCLVPFYGHKLIFPPLGQISASIIIDILKHTRVDVLAAPSSVLEDLSQMTDALTDLSLIKNVLFAGGPIAEEKGARLAKHTRLWNVMGSTECGKFPIKVHDEDDFNYFRFPLELKGLQFEEHEKDSGLYELCWVRDSETDNFHASWATFPELKEYHTKDLYSKHPTKLGLWRHCGRLDDVIALSNGEKLVAPPLEKIIEGCPIVKNALIVGHGRFEIALLIEPIFSTSTMSREEILTKIQPYVDKGNSLMPNFASLSLDMILLTNPEKPMARTSKGSVIRAHTTAIYAQEIEELYVTGPADVNSNDSTLLKDKSTAQTSETLVAIYQTVLGKDVDLQKDEDVFSKGFDSLCVMKATRKIQRALEAEGYQPDLMASSLLYSLPVIEKLAERLQEMARKGESPSDPSSNPGMSEGTRLHEMHAMMQKYKKSTKVKVLLTGSTGFLGSYILDSLISSELVQTIYVFNRATDGGSARHEEISRASNLSSDFGKVIFLHTQLDEPFLGLKKQDYLYLQNSIQVIIHNQWQVDFNLPLKSFEPHLAGLRNLLDMANGSSCKPCFLFVSSVAAIARYRDLQTITAENAVPETIQHDPKIAMPSGYGMSKYISECLLDIEGQQTGLRTSVIRLGQIAGPVVKLGGIWKKQEWLPSLIQSSIHLKMIPNDIGEVDWIPVDILADILVEISLHEHSLRTSPITSTTVYNIANPRAANWNKDILPTMLTYLPEETRVVDLKEWVQVLKGSIEDADEEITQADVEANPATRLLSFYEDASSQQPVRMGAKMEIQRVKKVSRVIQDLEAVNDRWISTWVDSWGLKRTA